MCEDLKRDLEACLTKQGFINTKKINKLFREYDLSSLEGSTPLEKAYLLNHEKTFCKTCGKETEFISFARGYKNFCSEECKRKYLSGKTKEFRASQSEEDITKSLKKYHETCLRKFGVPSASQSIEIKNKRKQTFQKRYGVDNPSQSEEIRNKIRQTNLEKYGVENPSQSKEVQEKVKQTVLKKYGVNNCFKSKEIQEKSKKTCIEKYGVEHPSQSKEIQEKSKKTCLKRYGVEHKSQSRENKDRISKTWQDKISLIEKERNCTSLSHLIEKYGSGWYQNENFSIKIFSEKGLKFINNSNIPLIEKYCEENTGNRSHAEIEVLEFCKNLLPGAEIISNTKQVIKSENGYPMELDIYIPSKKVAIEFNGCKWHAENRTKQLHKTEECEKQGIRLLHIWDDLWISKKSIYKSIIASALGVYNKKIYARDCECREISGDEYKTFLERNHIQGAINSSFRLGLFYNGELIQTAGWGKSRFKKDEYELHRMCSRLNTQVLGGFSKLIKHSKLKTFVSYVDRSLYNGKGYIACGFKTLDTTSPGYFYWSDTKGRLSRSKTQKHKLSKLLKNYNKDISELENLHNNGYMRVYDCGNYKVQYTAK